MEISGRRRGWRNGSRGRGCAAGRGMPPTAILGMPADTKAGHEPARFSARTCCSSSSGRRCALQRPRRAGRRDPQLRHRHQQLGGRPRRGRRFADRLRGDRGRFRQLQSGRDAVRPPGRGGRRLFGPFAEYDPYIVEWHRRTKADRPSGTAIELSRRLIAAHPRKQRVAQHSPTALPRPRSWTWP